jgi:carbon-monoxide dehydrogenase small subunit
LKHSLHIIVNEKPYDLNVDSRTLLVDLLRDQLQLTGTHVGCVEGKCGACSVLVNGVGQKSCLIFAAQIDGKEITTVEGLERKSELDPLQQSFWENHGTQCGFCTSGMLIAAKSLLAQNKSPSRDEIRLGISGNLCRCTGYVKIVEAIEQAVFSKRS